MIALGRRTLCFAWVGMVLASSVARADDDFVHVIPPGEERALVDLLGGDTELAGCRLDTATVDRTEVRVGYVCSGRAPVALALRHPSLGTGAVATTARFAIVASTALPDGFLAALSERMRDRERAFHWISAEAPGLGVPPPADAPSSVVADQTALTAEQSERYLVGVRLSRSGRQREAFEVFFALAREVPGHGVLGVMVAALASSMTDAASVARFTRAADAAPADTLAQFVAGVSVHYHGHREGRSLHEKRQLYRRAIQYLSRTLPAYSFEPRVYLYLAVSHFRLGHQAEAERLIELAVPLAANDPDVFYCRGEIFQRVNIQKAIVDIRRYLSMADQLRAQGIPINVHKHRRVQSMLRSLVAVSRGTETLPPDDALFDPIEVHDADSVGHRVTQSVSRIFGSSRSFAGLAALVAFIGSVALVRARRSRPS